MDLNAKIHSIFFNICYWKEAARADDLIGDLIIILFDNKFAKFDNLCKWANMLYFFAFLVIFVVKLL